MIRVRETDKLLFEGICPIIFREYPIIFHWVAKSKKKIEYPIKYLKWYRKYKGKVVLPNMNFTNTQLKNAIPNTFNFQG